MNENEKIEQTGKVVKNASQAYGYTYTSLADLAKAGIKIPKMRVKATEQGEYIEYWDGTDWQTGAKVVVPQMKGSNEAQMYGSALTYARRYTVMLAESVACDDDSKLETQDPEKSSGNAKGFHLDFEEVKAELEKMTTVGEVRIYYAKLMTNKMSDKQKDAIKKMCEDRANKTNEKEEK